MTISKKRNSRERWRNKLIMRDKEIDNLNSQRDFLGKCFAYSVIIILFLTTVICFIN